MSGLTLNQMKQDWKKTKWDLRYLDRAATLSLWSKDPSTKVGAVIVDQYHCPVSEGFNGLPQAVPEHREGRYLATRDIKWRHIIHGEMNALIFAKADISGGTLYTWPFLPCTVCASVMAQAGIREVVSTDIEREWDLETLAFLKECLVTVTRYKVQSIPDYDSEFGLSFPYYQSYLNT